MTQRTKATQKAPPSLMLHKGSVSSGIVIRFP